MRRAQQRILEASDKAAAKLVEMMQDKSVPPALQIAAARDLLDRAGLSGKQTIEVELTEKPTWLQVAEDILVDIEEDDDDFFPEDIVDAEIVEDDEPTQRRYELDTTEQQDRAALTARRESAVRKAAQPGKVDPKTKKRTTRNGSTDPKTGKRIPPSDSHEAEIHHMPRIATVRDTGGSRNTRGRMDRG